MFWRAPQALPEIAKDVSRKLLASRRPAGWDESVKKFLTAVNAADVPSLDASVDPMIDAVSRADPARAGLAAKLAGTMVEHGADPRRIGEAVGARLPAIAAAVAAGDMTLVNSLEGLCTAEVACLGRSKALRVDVKRHGLIGRAVESISERVEHVRIVLEMLSVLDDEEILVLHSDPPKAFQVRISGILDNFQLQTLLYAALINSEDPSMISGAPPDKTAVWAARGGQEVDRTWQSGGARNLHGTGIFNLVAWDGNWIWGEGKPADVPKLDGVRVVRFEPLPYRRSWGGIPFFPWMEAAAVVVRVLSEAEVTELSARMRPVEKGS